MRLVNLLVALAIVSMSFSFPHEDTCGIKADGQYHCGTNCSIKADGVFHCGHDCGLKSDGKFHCVDDGFAEESAM